VTFGYEGKGREGPEAVQTSVGACREFVGVRVSLDHRSSVLTGFTVPPNTKSGSFL
jgi:hypothetical protein